MTHEKLGIKIEAGYTDGVPQRVVSCIKCASKILSMPAVNIVGKPALKEKLERRILNATAKHACH